MLTCYTCDQERRIAPDTPVNHARWSLGEAQSGEPPVSEELIKSSRKSEMKSSTSKERLKM